MYLLLAFFCCYVFQIAGLYCATYTYLLLLITKIRTISLNDKYSRRSMGIILLFILWALISLISFSLDYKRFDIRNIVQFGFNFLYIFLALDIKYDYRRFNKYYIWVTLSFSAYMIFMYMWKGVSSGLLQVFSDRNWGDKYIIGFSNSTALPILFGMYLFLKEERYKKTTRIMFSAITLMAVILTTSRANMLGAFTIIIYFFAIKGKKLTGKRLFALLFISLCAVAFIIFWSARDATFAHRLLVTWDREEIFHATMDYVGRRPLIGYGGNTFDVVYEMFGSKVAGQNWLHTHNTVLELLLRYGIVGFFIFFAFIVSIYKKIKTKEARFMFLLLWLLSLTQLFFRNDIFVLITFFVIQETRQIKYDSIEGLIMI